MGMQCSISSRAIAAIRAHAAAEHPHEACGLMFGTAEAIEDVVAARNIAENPASRFEIDPAALFAALRAERAGGPPLVGYYHSHPSGTATPSATDAAQAAPDARLWLIVAGDDATLWRAIDGGATHGRFDAVELLAAADSLGQ